VTISLALIFNKLILIVLGIIVLGVLVFIHELGHFLIAKWCGIRVLAFSLGFGAPIIKKEFRGTEYRISAIPFGGYVKMAGENPEEAKEGPPDPGDFTSKPVWQRALVAVAGPGANFISALLMLWFMFIWGVEQPLYLEHPIVGAVMEQSAAEQAGIKAGDSLLTVNNREVNSWEDISSAFALQEKEYSLSYIRDGQKYTAVLLMKKSDDLIPKEHTGGIMPPLPAIVATVSPNSPAERAGIQKGDTIKTINNQTVFSWFQVLTLIKSYDTTEKTPLTITVARNSSVVSLSTSPEYDASSKRYIIGIMVDEGAKRIVKYPVVAAFHKGMDKGWEYTKMIFDIVGKLASREVSAKQLAGPVGIIPMSGGMALQGISTILNFMGLIGINLAVLNLMPLVITDGGMLLFLALEAIRRKPLSIKTQMLVNKIAIAFFLMLFLFVTFNDVQRLPEYFRIFGK
jgi:regulator of sigma E protease